jgi:hypothetical protein
MLLATAALLMALLVAANARPAAPAGDITVGPGAVTFGGTLERPSITDR